LRFEEEEADPDDATWPGLDTTSVQKTADLRPEKPEADPWQAPSKISAADVEPWALSAKKDVSKPSGKGAKGGTTGKGGATGKGHEEQSVPLASEEKTRSELVQAIFELCDADQNGYLGPDELRTFAGQTGFEGSHDEWMKEYELLCKEVKCAIAKGPSHQAFSQMVDDDTDAGCYCTDEELKEVYESLAKLYGLEEEEAHPDDATWPSLDTTSVQKTADPWAEKSEGSLASPSKE